MLQHFLSERIAQKLPFAPNAQQQELLHQLSEFMVSVNSEKVFVLKGYAGTGKTSIVAALVSTLADMDQKTVLLAPTGRAAKVISLYAKRSAFTIHKKIYRQRSMADWQFGLADNLHTHTLFVVDEASMIQNTPSEHTPFGSGQLLNDLIRYVYAGEGCSLLLVGDTAQLPPVMQSNSPALERMVLEGFGLNVHEYTLTLVARQTLESGILYNATQLRQQIAQETTLQKPTFELQPFTDIKKLQGEEVLELLEEAYRDVGIEETMVVTRTNRRAALYNQGIRARILWKDDEVSTGDRIMVTRNNYFWTKQYDGLDFLANGDTLEILRIRKMRSLYGFRFADVSLRSVEYEWEIDATILVESLSADTPEQVRTMSETLFQAIAQDYPEIRSKKELVKTILENPYYNALQIKFSYAITCHKAQGGQWKRIFIDQGPIAAEQIDTSYYRWLYTAVTRASEKLFLINF